MDLFFREEGNQGKNIVIVHGLYGSSDNWMTVGKKLNHNYHVFMIDQRNHGRSPKADIHSYETMKEDLAEFFEQRQLEKAIVIGHSMGGKTAMYFAAEYPEKVEKLVVIDIAPKDYFQIQEGSQYYLHQHILQTLKEIPKNNFNNRKEIADFLNLKIDGANLVQFLLKNVYRDKETGNFECRINVNVLYDSLDEIIRGMNYRCLADRKPILNYPVLFIKGEKSNYITKEDEAFIKDIYPKALIESIPDAGHWLHAEQPQLFMTLLESFL